MNAGVSWGREGRLTLFLRCVCPRSPRLITEETSTYLCLAVIHPLAQTTLRVKIKFFEAEHTQVLTTPLKMWQSIFTIISFGVSTITSKFACVTGPPNPNAVLSDPCGSTTMHIMQYLKPPLDSLRDLEHLSGDSPCDHCRSTLPRQPPSS